MTIYLYDRHLRFFQTNRKMKKKVSIIFGGKSTEHEVSLNSASNIFNAVDTTQFDPILLGMDKQGDWFYNAAYPTSNINLPNHDFFQNATPVFLDRRDGEICIVGKEQNTVIDNFEVAFSIIHGTGGEDGNLQGFFNTMGVPFVGPDVLGSSLCMDKDVTKRILRESNIPLAKSITLLKLKKDTITYEQAEKELGVPLFVKPCNAGSSVGVSKVTDKATFEKAIDHAFQFDHKLLIEEAVVGKEIECAVLGNEEPKTSVVGEIVATKDFYSYDAKYKDADAAVLKIPAKIDEAISSQIRNIAVEAFKATCCEGLARVDFFLRADNTFVINEINTLPGFTEISMYPKMWEATGTSYADLITNLIELGLARHERNSALQTMK